MVSLVAGVTLVVLVSMVTLDLVCGGQEGGEDSRLAHTHLTHTQRHYTPQTGGARSTTFSYIQRTARSGIFQNNGIFEGIRLADAESAGPFHGHEDKAKFKNEKMEIAMRQPNAIDDNECNEINCIGNFNKNGNAGPKHNSIGNIEFNGVVKNTVLTDDPIGHSDKGPVVLTHSGPVRGLTLDKAHVFYGIPYAAPPVGPKRWTAPKPVSPWTQPYDATFPRPACMQVCAGEFSEMCPPKISEDCLYLNVFVPLSVDLSKPKTKALPVMVWIHGGDFIAGSASKPLYDGRFISNYSNTLVVNMEYRLGAFGFLVTGKDPQSSAVGNYGILDQQAALQWVHQNIAAFGGDPAKVTLFGESAGAQSVSLHLMMQISEPLFRHAAVQSQPFSIPLKTRFDAMKLGRDFVKLTNCSASDLACLRSLSSHTILKAQVKAGSKIINPFRFLEMFETWGPYIDGQLLKEQPITAFQKGRWQSYKPVILGTTSEEGVIFVYGVFTESVSVLECIVYTTAIFKQHTLSILYKYVPLYHNQDRRIMLSQIVTDFVFLCPTRRSARSAISLGGSVWMYVFDHSPSDHNIWSGLTFCYDRACHGAELPFLFDSAPETNLTLTAQETHLANQMVCYWGAFAHSGDPNSRTEQTPFCSQQRLPVWPRYTSAESWPILNFTLQSHPQHGNREDICDFWDELDIY
ncbi:cAMP-regulated D2 protein [Astyanax mexicanus]|uniref:Carboxylic ester hydrolase n=2 Tax=Astyanax mexicanus TaxID=7994 RepID=A0A8B9RB24_ASTMX|nr:cAMP-regulated D2 protein [Astyanax mexicanus]KAG9272999.1 cAMP-regulated D2 protein-like [Astyanax mexicanus]